MNANRIKMMFVVCVVVTLLASPGTGYALGGGTLGSADVGFLGAVAGDQAGDSVAGAGDVNGDGYADFLVGVPYNDTGGSNAGAAYLVLGGPGGWGPGASRGWGQGIDLGSAGVISYTGEMPGDQAGTSVAGAGDVNGDGYADFLVGAEGNDGGGTYAGAAYLVLGSAAPASGSLSSAIRYTGVMTNDHAGTSVAGAGDVNGDGFSDFLVGAYWNDDAGLEAGAAYLVLGGPGGWGQGIDLGSAGVIRYTGEMEGDWAGWSVAGAGDVNGDGYADFLVGAYNNDPGANNNAGSAYLVLGSASPVSASLSSAIRYAGEAANDNAGYSVAGAGDVNGDGYADSLVGARYNGDGGSLAGAAYLVLGSADPASGSLSSAIQYRGETASDLAGYSVAGAGDVNGDGYADFLVGAYQNGDGGTYAGAVYLVLGSTSPGGGSLSSAIQYRGEAAEDNAGRSVAGAGDVNGDGYADFLAGVRYNDAGGTDAGAAYLLFSDYLASGAAPIRQRQRLLDNSGDALPVSFEQAGVRVDLASNALAGGDITVERHIFHPCNTEGRLQMPIWSISSSKHHNASDGSSTTNLTFHYTNAQLGDMNEDGLQVWWRPIGQPCGEWSMVSTVSRVVTSSLNLVTVSDLDTLGNQYILSVDPPPTTVGMLTVGARRPSAGLVWAVPLLALVAAFVYWLWRRVRLAPVVAKSERSQRLALRRCRGFVRRSGGRERARAVGRPLL